jgi:hypothetical protein
MTKKILPLFVLVTLAACLLSYKVGSAPVALAKGRSAPEGASESAAPLTLPAAPATWSLTNAGGLGNPTEVYVTEPALAGVQHVATCITATYVNAGATGSASGAGLFLVNGNYGGPGVLHWELLATNGNSSSINLCGLNVVGSVDTPMTLEIANLPNAYVTVNLVGYDAQ